jgi:hypothetical protein
MKSVLESDPESNEVCLTGAPTTSLTIAEAAETMTNLISCPELVVSSVRRGQIMLYVSFPLLIKLVTSTGNWYGGYLRGLALFTFLNQILIFDYYFESGEISKFVFRRVILNSCSESNHSPQLTKL